MATLPEPVAKFLGGKRFAVAGVSRSGKEAANAVFRKLVAAGYEVVPINPNADEVEGVRCYRDLLDIPGALDGVVIATPPAAAATIVHKCAQVGVRRVWFHRAFGDGSVSEEAVDLCRAKGIDCIAGGCPLMFVTPVDIGHRCMRWWLQRRGVVPR